MLFVNWFLAISYQPLVTPNFLNCGNFTTKIKVAFSYAVISRQLEHQDKRIRYVRSMMFLTFQFSSVAWQN